ncbi:hypothetical protein MMYC01_208834 [Madurella mycetomatis]|uniref:Uncharacterized protein n=1 Tax=Madurella mycetomatis TaxID=100816 RepID=A0A175VQ49_9PEZI|nr:hypothetical protein MMYC01_210045 [Madurella mycetomatis]KXX74216.1 hypothetical protein MMYC01_208834 [Madurella mycetomatis]
MSSDSDSDSDSWTLPPELYHRDYTEVPKSTFKYGEELSDPSPWTRSMVKLEFRKNGAEKFGTAFYLDIPEAKYKNTSVNVILTAAHNLISENGMRTTQLKVFSEESNDGWLVRDEYVRICPEYEENPEEDGSPFDWGVIFEPKGKQRLKKGKGEHRFRYNLAFAVNPPSHREENVLFQFMKAHIKISGYKNKGKIERQGTDPGKGVRLNLDVLQQLFDWAGVARRSVSLKGYNTERFHDEGLYLRFPSPEAFGRVRLGAHELNTAFDILPAGRTAEGEATYVFRLLQPPGWPTEGAEYLWVLWDPARDRAVLSPTLHKYSVVVLYKIDPSKPQFSILPVGVPGGGEKQLIMGSEYIHREDLCYGPVESSEVSFGPWDGDPTSFFIFVQGT